MKLQPEFKIRLEKSLEKSGLRSTKQREHVYGIILSKRDHPTADEVYVRAKEDMPSISLATVYNCLETLVGADLVRMVNFERQPTRYCPNLRPHAHFHCDRTGRIYDVNLPQNAVQFLEQLMPTGFKITHLELSFNGESPDATPTAPQAQSKSETS